MYTACSLYFSSSHTHVHVYTHRVAVKSDKKDCMGRCGPGFTPQDAKIRTMLEHLLSENLSHPFITNQCLSCWHEKPIPVLLFVWMQSFRRKQNYTKCHSRRTEMSRTWYLTHIAYSLCVMSVLIGMEMIKFNKLW